MKCSICGEEAVSLVASVVCHHDFEIMRYDARCKKHNEVTPVEMQHFETE